MTDGGGGVAVGAEYCVLRGPWCVVYVFTCVRVYVVRVACCVFRLLGVLVEGGEVFDAENGFGADGLK